MRILLAHNSTYYPAHGGGDKSNRLLIEALAARGHNCRVIARTERFSPEQHEKLLAQLAGRNIVPRTVGAGLVTFDLGGVEVHTATNLPNLRSYFASQIGEFDPDVIITSTDDPAQLLLELALRAERARVVYLVRATIAVPFGPDAAFPSAGKTDVLRQVDAVVGVSQYVATYVTQWSGIDAVHVPISLQDRGPFAALGAFDNDFVTMVNPCAVKGIGIFLEVAEALPDVRFAAVPTWGTSDDDLDALKRHSNVTILPPADNIDDVLKRTRVLVVPSVWAEARSRIIPEAMLRGVPVLAANVGGIPEAMMGVDYLLPVNAIAHYHTRVDKQMVPVPEVPPQDVTPWVDALRRVTSDREHWTQLSRRAREAAHAYVEAATVEPFERLLVDVISKASRQRAAATPSKSNTVLDTLSPEKRKLLALRLKKKAAESHHVATSIWFPFVETGADVKLRMFCFPFAGGGAAAYRGWIGKLGAGVAVSPARLPGRETRIAEPPITDMAHLITALHGAILPFLETPFAFFGHSMGAVIAYELAHSLRRHNELQPVCLIASGARAPQFRLGHVPPSEPSEEEFLAELRMREGTPREVLDNQELLRFVLPALKADAALYRNYVYVPVPPLDCAVIAYGGTEDPNVSEVQVDAWREATSGPFVRRMLPGGHFFLHAPAFANTLADDLHGAIAGSPTGEPSGSIAGSEKRSSLKYPPTTLGSS